MILQLNSNLLREALGAALTNFDEPSFYQALRASVRKLIISQLGGDTLRLTSAEALRGGRRLTRLVNGSLKDIEFASRYGFGFYSVAALNYLDGDLVRFNSLLPFTKRPSFSIGNLLFASSQVIGNMTLESDDSFLVAGFEVATSPKGKKHHLCLYDVRLSASAVGSALPLIPPGSRIDPLRPCDCPPTWIDRYSGRVFTCECFSGLAKTHQLPLNSHFPNIDPSTLPGLEVRSGLCAICSDHIPPPEAGHPMYYNSFLVRYLPYRTLFHFLLHGGRELPINEWEAAERAAENAAREAVGYPRIGEQWPSETLLYRLVCQILEGYEVINHHKPEFLEGLEFDIFIPSLKMGIEYQGVQHYKPVTRFGGEDGFNRLQARDARKRLLAASNGIFLHEWHYEKPITEGMVREIVGKRRRQLAEAKTTC